MLSGIGITPSSSVNITYLNPTNSSWLPLINNYDTVAGAFTYSFNAPDLLRNIPAGDTQPQFDSIIFRAQDNSSGRYYNTTVAYTEWRRGLTQLSGTSATGLFGNNTDLDATTFVQNGQSIVVAGQWFNTVNGAVSLLWDGTLSLGTAAIDGTGFLNATVQVPTTTAGQHTLTIDDGASVFCVNLTRLTTVANDYVDEWHSTDFQINLTPDYAVTETFYRINGGSVLNVTSNGQPMITTEGGSNSLEYWSTWNVYGTGNMDLPHVTVTGIKLDKTAPTGSITVSSSNVYSGSVVTFDAGDSVDDSGIVSYVWDFGDGSSGFGVTATHTYASAGTYTADLTVQDLAGYTATSSATISVTPQPTSSPTAAPTNAPTTTNPTASPTSPTTQPIPTPQAPEISIQMTLILLAVSTLMLTILLKRKRK